MILLVDADSLIFAACYKKRENPEDDKYYRDIEDAQAKFDEQFMSLLWSWMKNSTVHAKDKHFENWHPEFLFKEEAICPSCKVNECKHLPKIDRRTYHEDEEIGNML